MFEQKLTNYFKRYATIQPRSEFLARSRPKVSALPQIVTISWRSRFIESLTTSGALALASFLLIAVIAGISFVAERSGARMANAGLNNAALTREASDVTFRLEIQQAQYFDESASQVVRALENISAEKVH